MSFFKGRKAVLATMHGKEKVILPLMKELGIDVVVPQNFDTDRFGTFTRDVARAGDQIEAARAKALEAMNATGLDLAIASEGSFGPDRDIPFANSNLELVLLVDRQNNLEIHGHHKSFDTNMAGTYVSSVDEALDFARSVGFPEHAVIVRKNKDSKKQIHKGIKSEEELREVVQKMLSKFFVRRVYIETDMRAHMNPRRMQNIVHATKDLLRNIQSVCTECETPGFAIVDTTGSRVCTGCGIKTGTPLYAIKRCQKCLHELKELIDNSVTDDPANCPRCNP